MLFINHLNKKQWWKFDKENLTAFNCICYEAKKQKEGDYSFIIDCKQLMTELREKINSNYEEIKNDFIEIDRWIENVTSDV